MLKQIVIVFVTLLCLAAPIATAAIEQGRRAIIYDGVVTEVAAPPAAVAAPNSTDLWITLADWVATGTVGGFDPALQRSAAAQSRQLELQAPGLGFVRRRARLQNQLSEGSAEARPQTG
jgi:hypothetical protein